MNVTPQLSCGLKDTILYAMKHMRHFVRQEPCIALHEQLLKGAHGGILVQRTR